MLVRTPRRPMAVAAAAPQTRRRPDRESRERVNIEINSALGPSL